MIVNGVLGIALLTVIAIQLLGIGQTWMAAVIAIALVPIVIALVLPMSVAARLTIGGVCFMIGAGTITTLVTWSVDGRYPVLLALAPSYLAYGLLEIIRSGRRFLDVSPDLPGPDYHEMLFHRHILILGAGLLIGGLLSCIVLSGLVATDQIDLASESEIPPFDPLMLSGPLPDTLEPEQVISPGQRDAYVRNLAKLLLLSAGGAALGAILFVANSCRTEQSKLTKGDHSIEFSPDFFWGGLWFRIGEAIVFTLGIFILLWIIRTDPDGADAAIFPVRSFAWMPLIALFLGMFVREGERLMEGLQSRTFMVLDALIKGRSDQTDTPAPPKATLPAPDEDAAVPKAKEKKKKKKRKP